MTLPTVPTVPSYAGMRTCSYGMTSGCSQWMDKTRLAMLQILEERYERMSVIIASQLSIAKWYDYIGDPTLADAIMDHLVANASKIELKGDSMRQKLKK